jgi:hypothetical protein
MLLATAEKNFQYRGDLSETALPEILNTIDRFQVPGVIEAERDGVVKKVFIKEGRVVHATSSDRNDSLGGFLLRSGKITPSQFAETMLEREGAGKRYGVLLVEAGLLSPVEVHQAIRKHIEAIVWSLFYWITGRVTFSIGAPPEGDNIRVHLPMRQVVLQGIKRAPNAKALVARLGRRETVLEPCYQIDEVIELALDADELALLARVDGQRTLYEVCTGGTLSASDNAKLMYAFHVLQLIREPRVAQNESEGARREQRSGAVKIRLKAPGDRFADR